MLFDLFERKKIALWEIKFLKIVFSKKISDENQNIYSQISRGLLKIVLIGAGDIPNYVGFGYNSSIYDEFYNSKGKYYKLSDIYVKDIYTNQCLSVSIYIAYGVIIGYSIDKEERIKRYKFDIDSVDVDSLHKIMIGNDNYKNVAPFLSEAERKIINENDIYVTELNGKDYYHLKELDDGDFIGIDNNNHIYHITHDPFKIVPIERDRLVDILRTRDTIL